jgi:hypothetical protein
MERVRAATRRSQRSVVAWQKSMMRWSLVGVLALGLFTAGFFVFSPSMRLREITVARTSQRLDIERAQAALSPLFGQHLLFLTPADVRIPIEQAFPDMADVTMRKQYPSNIVVTVELQPLLAHLVIQSPDDTAGEPIVMTGSLVDALTDRGIYVLAPESEEVFQSSPIFLVDWGVRPVPGTALLTPEMLRTIGEARHLLGQQFGHEVTRTTVYLRAQEFHLQLGGRISLWFDSHSKLQDQLMRYRTFLKEVPLDTVTEYIDLRLTDRVAYK